MKMTLEAGESTQMFSFFPHLYLSPSSHTYTDHWREEEKMRGEEVGGGREKRGKLEKKCGGRAAVQVALWGAEPIR